MSQTDSAERIRAALKSNPRAMTMMVAQELGVPEAEVIRHLPDGAGVELKLERWEEILRSFEALGKVHVIASNAAVTLEAVGAFGGFSTTGPFFNVQTDSLDMHIRYRNFGAIFAVEKLGHMDGQKTYSVQFFDAAGNAAFKVFLNFGAAATAERVAAFQKLRSDYKK